MVPVSGLSAVDDSRPSGATVPSLCLGGAGLPCLVDPGAGSTSGSGSVDLVDSSGVVRATYSGLDVTDAVGDAVPASLSVGQGGQVIDITVSDADAVYPLTVDPTWTQVTEPTAGDGRRMTSSARRLRSPGRSP